MGSFSKVWKGEGLHNALQAVELLNQEGTPVSKDLLRCILQGCIKKKDLAAGRRLHSLMIDIGLNSVDSLGGDLVRLFVSCGSLHEANEAFCNVSKPSVYTWNAVISAHTKLGKGGKALELYRKMSQAAIMPDKVTFLYILKACSSIGAIDESRVIHEKIVKNGLHSDAVVGSAIIDMYAKCGRLEDAGEVFNKLPSRDVVSWGAIIAGYVVHGHGCLALEFMKRMQQEGRRPNRVIYSCVLKACGSIGAIVEGMLIHNEILSSGLISDTVLGNTLVDMYAKCGRIEEAHKVFDDLPVRNLVSWGAIISGYSEQGHGFSALELFWKMQEEGIKPDKVMFLCLLKACHSVGAIVHGRLIHEQAIKSGLNSDPLIESTLVDMYAKSGSLEEAHKVFDGLLNCNIVSWDAIIAGLAQYGNFSLAVQWFEHMQIQGFLPDSMAFVSILNTCSHAGLLEEGCWYFKSMIEDHGIIPTIEHYSCMVDLLGRAGRLCEAEDLLKSMPIPVNIILWTSLLASCRTYGNAQLGRQCFDHFVLLDPNDASGYTLMNNVYADNHSWEDAATIQQQRKGAAAQKKPGRAWIEGKEKAEEFVVGGKSNAQSDEIYAKIKEIMRMMMDGGYVPQLDLVFERMIDRNDGEFSLGGILSEDA